MKQSNQSVEFSEKIISYIGKEMSGGEFNSLFSDVEFVKLTNKSEIHNGHQFQDGLNIDIHKFDHHEQCSKGGFYFTAIKYAYHWIYYNGIVNVMHNIRKVIIPDDAKVFIESYNKYKIDKFILDPKETIPVNTYIDHIKYECYNIHIFEKLFNTIRNKQLYLETIEWSPFMIKYIPYNERDEELCIKAVMQCRDVVEYVPKHIFDKIKQHFIDNSSEANEESRSY